MRNARSWRWSASPVRASPASLQADCPKNELAPKRYLQLTLSERLSGGQVMQATTPDGKIFSVTVPAGTVVGTSFCAPVPGTSGAAAMPHMLLLLKPLTLLVGMVLQVRVAGSITSTESPCPGAL